jgi:hypothetical protein
VVIYPAIRILLTHCEGPFPKPKFTTLTNRLVRSYIEPSLLFFRTSPTSRGTPRFLSEARIIPPLLYTACLHALHTISLTTSVLEVHHADEEGDPYAVELAGRVDGYVAGLDSDYAILNVEGYLGYIPLDEMIWSDHLPDQEPIPDDGDDFQVVKKPKGKKKIDPTFWRGVTPPDVSRGLTLSLVFYNPSSLASHLNLPVLLLPLLGSCVGNDYSNQSASPQRNVQWMFFDRQLTPSQRIARVASTLQSFLSAPPQKRKQKQQIGSAMDLVEGTVNALLTRSSSTLGSGDVKTIVDRIVDATLQYAIPKFDGAAGEDGLWPTVMCALHEPEVCNVLPFFSRLLAAEAMVAGEESEEVVRRDVIRRLYLAAYREGRLSPRMMNVLSTGTYWPRLFLENPDVETVSASIGRRIRQWTYSILEDAVGLPYTQGEDEGESEGEDGAEDDESELIDVIEEDSDEDQLAPLRGELKRLHSSSDESKKAAALPKTQSLPLPQPRYITEYIRRGTRVVEDVVPVPPIADLLASVFDSAPQGCVPLQLRPEEERLSLLLRVVQSDTPLVRALPRYQLMAALALRWVTHVLHVRGQDSADRSKERWTRHEAQSFLASFSWATTRVPPVAAAIPKDNPPIDNRNVSLMAQILMALESIEHLSQVLLLSERLPTPVHLLSGKTCHSYWTGARPLNPAAIPSGLWDACTGGLEDLFGEEKQKKAKRGRKEKEVAGPVVARAGSRGTFEVLANMQI